MIQMNNNKDIRCSLDRYKAGESNPTCARNAEGK